jgi:raffinose/stachyose/melibiose transport system permease protein
MYESASLDGAGRWNLFRLITIRMIASAVTVNVLLAVVGSLNTYDTIYVLTGGAANTMTLGMLMFSTAFESSSDLGLGAAISMLMFALTLAIALPLQAWLRRREVAA